LFVFARHSEPKAQNPRISSPRQQSTRRATNPEGHGFSRAVKAAPIGASSLPKAGVEAQPERLICSSLNRHNTTPAGAPV